MQFVFGGIFCCFFLLLHDSFASFFSSPSFDFIVDHVFRVCMSLVYTKRMRSLPFSGSCNHMALLREEKSYCTRTQTQRKTKTLGSGHVNTENILIMEKPTKKNFSLQCHQTKIFFCSFKFCHTLIVYRLGIIYKMYLHRVLHTH